MTQKITLIGAGLTGPLLSTYLSKYGYEVEIFERRPDMRKESITAGRSINLALSARGIHALKEVGLYEKIAPLTIPMKGRMIHDVSGKTQLHPYGQKENEVIFSVSRAELNKALMTLAEATGQVKIHFNQQCTFVDLEKKEFKIYNPMTNVENTRVYELIMGVDGSASAVRDAMLKIGQINYRFHPLGHGYKELTVLPSKTNGFQMEPNALHIWPRGKFMLISLPNIDHTFTCTLFLPVEGEISFETIKGENDILNLFKQYFPDTLPLISKLVEEFQSKPVGQLGSVYCDPWHFENTAVLLGDAAHAVVPFFGQGMNASFQDCTVLNSLIEKHDHDWGKILADFSKIHVQDGHAIADMAIENYEEMRDKVNDPYYKKRRALELKMERFFPGEFIARYSMVSFHLLPYAEVYQRGERQFNIMDDILKKHDPETLDIELANHFFQ